MNSMNPYEHLSVYFQILFLLHGGIRKTIHNYSYRSCTCVHEERSADTAQVQPAGGDLYASVTAFGDLGHLLAGLAKGDPVNRDRQRKSIWLAEVRNGAVRPILEARP